MKVIFKRLYELIDTTVDYQSTEVEWIISNDGIKVNGIEIPFSFKTVYGEVCEVEVEGCGEESIDYEARGTSIGHCSVFITEGGSSFTTIPQNIKFIKVNGTPYKVVKNHLYEGDHPGYGKELLYTESVYIFRAEKVLKGIKNEKLCN